MNSSNDGMRLASACSQVAEAAADAIAWVDEVRQTSTDVQRAADNIFEELRSSRNAALKLASAAKGPVAVSVFGPSQAGKSFLVSAMTRGRAPDLAIRLGGKPYQFIRDINPAAGGRESTGIVTRFSASPLSEPATHPVHLSLLSETDIVKILVNSVFSDFDRERANLKIAEPEEVSHRLDEVRGRTEGARSSVSEDDVFDLRLYFRDYFPSQIENLVLADYWTQAMKLAPALSLEKRERLFSVLWCDVEPLTMLYRRLAGALEAIGHPDEVWAPLGILLERDRSIIDVATLGILGQKSRDDTVEIAHAGPDGSKGKAGTISRAALAALTAELRLTLADAPPYPFLAQTDLLDFPGARSRENYKSVEEMVTDSGERSGEKLELDPLSRLLLRGKVSYLFQRYADRREVNNVLLCIPPNPLEVRGLDDMIQEWISKNLGDSAARKLLEHKSLFFVLTKFDEHLQPVADSAMPALWTNRFASSLKEKFSKGRDSWVENWDGKPFDNVFWVRNPQAKRVIQIKSEPLPDNRHNELAINPDEENYLGRLKASFVGNPDVAKHVANPEAAWEAVWTMNDGGVTYLAEHLAPACVVSEKYRQLGSRLVEIAKSIDIRLRPHYRGDSENERARKGKALGVLLAAMKEEPNLGRLLASLQISADELRGVYMSVRRGIKTRRTNDSKPPAAPQEVDLDAFFGAGAGGAAAPAVSDDMASRFADAAQKRWVALMREVVENDTLLSSLRLLAVREQVGFLVGELELGATRLEVMSRIVPDLRRVEEGLSARMEEVIERQVATAAAALNNFVAFLGYGDTELAKRPGIPPDRPTRHVFEGASSFDGPPPLQESSISYYQVYFRDWMRAMLEMARENISVTASKGRGVTEDQNVRLKRILDVAAQASMGSM